MSLPPRILYVDDDVDACEMMSFWLREECGYDVSTALDGHKALQMIETEFFDLFLLDYCLPDMTAVSLCESIRALNPNAPILIYSALDRDVDQQRAFTAGADYYLVKPDQLADIRPNVDRLLGRHDQRLHSPGVEFRTITHHAPLRRIRAGGIV